MSLDVSRLMTDAGRPAAGPPPMAPQDAQKSLTGRRPGGVEQCVLLVDDDRGSNHAVAQAIGTRWCVLTARTAREALRLLDTFDIDLILTNVTLPDMDGLTLVDQARARFVRLGAAFFSASWTAEATTLALQRSRHLLTKPFVADDLGKRVEEILGRRPAQPAAGIVNGSEILKSCGVATQFTQSKKSAAGESGLRFSVPDDEFAPALRQGDVLWVRAVKESSLRRGDLVVVFSREKTVVRRFLRLSDAQDAVLVKDAAGSIERVPLPQVIGRGARCERSGRAHRLRGLRDETLPWWKRLFA